MEVGQELRDFLVAGPELGIFGGRVDLDAIAGREQHGLGLRKPLPQAVERLRRPAPGLKASRSRTATDEW